MSKPDEFESPLLGRLTRVDRATFRGDISWCGARAALSVGTSGEGGLAGAVRHGEALIADQVAWDERVRRFAVEKLLGLKNNTWLEENEMPVSPAEFASRMQLLEVEVQPDGAFAFTFSDGDLFWGHWIVVGGGVADGPSFADILG